MIVDRDWDILILLDACRYDYFKKYNQYIGKLSEFDIGCTGTKKFFELISSDVGNKKEIVIINHIILLSKWINIDSFFEVVNAQEISWNSKYGTVLPEDNTQLALEYMKENPDKRIIIHYAQPHIPFLDRSTHIIKQKTHREVIYNNGYIDVIMKWLNTCKNIFPPIPFWLIERTFGSSAGIGEIYFKEGFDGIKKSYIYNLKRVLKSIEPIVKMNHKKVVITSDHGKIIGEYYMFSHGWWKSKCVTTVPWFEVGNK